MAPPTASEDPDLTEWQKRLSDKEEELQRLQEELASAKAEKEAAILACASGTAAARAQINRLHGELVAARARSTAAAERAEALAHDAQAAELDTVEVKDVTEAHGEDEVDEEDFNIFIEAIASKLSNHHENIYEMIVEFLTRVHALEAEGPVRSDFPPFDFSVPGSESTDVERITIDLSVHRNDNLYQVAYKSGRAILSKKALSEGSARSEEGAKRVQLQQPQNSDAESQERREQLELQLRALRLEVSKWKHQADVLEKQCPKQEAEIVHLKAELTHTVDILESTRREARHHEVEQELRARGLSHVGSDSNSSDRCEVPLFCGGHGGVEAAAERGIRERLEQRNSKMSHKSKQLMGIAASQQLLIQRLEKALVKEEAHLGNKDARVGYEAQKQQALKVDLRKRSDYAVAAALGVPRARRQLAALNGSVTPASAGKEAHGLKSSASAGVLDSELG